MTRARPAVRCRLPALLLAIAACAPPAFAAAASAPAPAASTSARETATRAQLAAIRAEIARIGDAQRATAARRDSLGAQLEQQAAQLDAASNAARASDAAIAAQADSLATLEQQRADIEARLAAQRGALADLLRAAYTLDRGSDVAMLLGADDVARIDRALAYSRYFQRDRVARIHTLLGDAAQLDKVKAGIDAQTAALQQQRTQHAQEAARLEQARDAQQKLLAQSDAQLAAQQDKLKALQRDADALDQLLKQLQNVFADIPAQVGQTPPFSNLRGRLPWPVAGRARPGGARAQGVVIAAQPGATVRAVAYGRVAWASFMRGYGILVIVDQGGGWMSLYGGNESASVAVGDWVKPGQPIATVARNPEPGGAWFGLRRDGQPVDPSGWFRSGG